MLTKAEIAGRSFYLVHAMSEAGQQSSHSSTVSGIQAPPIFLYYYFNTWLTRKSMENSELPQTKNDTSLHSEPIAQI